MSVRKRTWTGHGVQKEAWIVTYFDIKGVKRQKTFARKREADAFASKTDTEVREGVHIADRESVSVKTAGELWIATGEGEGLERSTLDQRRRHLRFHIEAFIGETFISKLSVPAVREFEDRLRAEGRSSVMIKKVLVSLGGILADAMERGLATRNSVRDIRRSRKGRHRRQEKRQKGRLEVGVDIPTRDEIRALLGALEGNWRPLLLTVVFTGMRSSELRGLRWQDVDFQRGEINIRQRVDQYREVGPPKSEAGSRTIPVPPLVTNTLKELKLKQGNKPGLVFPNPDGDSRSHSNVVRKGLQPAMVRAGVTIDTGKPDKNGNPILKAKYTGLHALRHFYASWLINRKEDGGLSLPAKMVQERLGHASIVMTMDVYGHLFPRSDDGKELEQAANTLFSAT
ncbi:site-specific integrase [Rhizobium leguminosarum]|uniref:tyrosine-type recombinase/integrase n=1 Tax=Rhizobium ruizarguesonis TaxID=2081791 RepID=UPI0013E0B8AD|nr:site-specific integrase [Rhizobium ruizarguesonis]NEJ95270.1 tyrosine-type recombinase/integrase [Rhizobium ruizarguesonis]QIJ40283.1 site-specific integrase [Rhizobium leguminosarum]